VLEEVALEHAPVELGLGQEVVVDAVLLARARRARGGRHRQLQLGHPLQQRPDQGPLADAGGTRDHEDGQPTTVG
jgi:hypothetical protein